MPRRIRKVGAPLGVIIGLGVLIGCVLILTTLTNPIGMTIGFVLASIATAVVLLTYLWFDRWEPEPPRLLIFAFIVVVIGGFGSIGGTAIAALLVGLVQQMANYYVGSGIGDVSVVLLLAAVLLVRPAGLTGRTA